MASRAERGECSALYDGVVGARRAGALQAKRVAYKFAAFLRTSFGTPSAPRRSARPSINRGTVSYTFPLRCFYNAFSLTN